MTDNNRFLKKEDLFAFVKVERVLLTFLAIVSLFTVIYLLFLNIKHRDWIQISGTLIRERQEVKIVCPKMEHWYSCKMDGLIYKARQKHFFSARESDSEQITVLVNPENHMDMIPKSVISVRKRLAGLMRYIIFCHVEFWIWNVYFSFCQLLANHLLDFLEVLWEKVYKIQKQQKKSFVGKSGHKIRLADAGR